MNVMHLTACLALAGLGGHASLSDERPVSTASISTMQQHEERGGGGACCMLDGSCIDVFDEWECFKMEGMFNGGTTCAEVSCPQPCPPATFFDTVARPLEISCLSGSIEWFGDQMDLGVIRIDLNGNGASEIINRFPSSAREWQVPPKGDGYWNEWNSVGRVNQMGETVGSLAVTSLLDLHPDAMFYEGYDIGEEYNIHFRDMLDVTGDGLVDAIIEVDGIIFYAQNISTPPASACATDINEDGIVNVNDLLAVIADWGPCM